MGKILYLSYDGLTDPLGQSQIIPYLLGLSSVGHEISIISCEKEMLFNSKRKSIREKIKGSTINWKPILYHRYPPVISTIYDVFRIWRLAKKIHAKEKFQIVHCRSYISALIGLELKRRFNIKFIFDMRGFWADEKIEGGGWKIKNPLYSGIYSFFKKKEIQFIKEADFIISLTNSAKAEIKSWGIREGIEQSIKVIPCCVDLQLFDPDAISIKKVQSIRRNLSVKEDDIVLLYLGSLGTCYKLEEMLDFFRLFSRNDPKYKFLFVTRDDSKMIFEIANQKAIDPNLIIVKEADRKEIPLYISLASVSIFFYNASFARKATSPTKQGEILAMGLPIIANSGIGDCDQILKDYNCGLVVKRFSSEDYQQVINNLDKYLDKEVLHYRKVANDLFSLNEGIKSYAEIYRDILDKK